MNRAALLLASLAAMSGALAPAGAAVRTSLPDIEDEVMCLTCGTILQIANGPQAERQRNFIRDQIARGRTKEQIKRALVVQYGPRVLAVPPKSGFDLTAWLVPGAAIVIAAALIFVVVARWRRQPRAGAATPPLSPDEAERVREDLARYDL